MSDFVLAAIQAAPVYFDKDACTGKACHLIAEAAAMGATVAAFSECWLCGYPVFHQAPRSSTRWNAGAEYIASAVEIPGPETERLCEAARQAAVDIVIGVSELDEHTKATVYATLLFISRSGEILGKHRKLKPTYTERTTWGEGDGSALCVYDRPYARISGLNCWEHQMMRPGYALAAQGTQIHVAAWPGREPETAPEPPAPLWPRQTLLSRAFASQAGAYVICVSGILRKEHYPAEYRDLVGVELDGCSCIIDPRGEIIAGPVRGEETILTASGSLDLVRAVKSVVDIGGHYSRPDVFEFRVRPRARTAGADAPADVEQESASVSPNRAIEMPATDLGDDRSRLQGERPR
jgi:nitrilase